MQYSIRRGVVKMGFVKCNKNKIISASLIMAVLGLTFSNVVGLFNGQGVFDSKTNGVLVQRIDDNHAKLNCGSLKATENDLLFSKSEVSGEYQYDISNFNSENTLL